MRYAKAIAAIGLVGLASLMPTVVEAACGCSAMTLKHAGTTGTMCSDNDLPDFIGTECKRYTGSSKGCTTTWAYVCKLGVNSQDFLDAEPYQKTGFMPVATLTSGSNLPECTHGQVLQETIRSAGFVAANPNILETSLSGAVSLAGHAVNIDNLPTHTFPQTGSIGAGGNLLFGGDNYNDVADAHKLFNKTDTSVSWWDNPDQTKDNLPEVAAWDFKFISFVNGSAGQASCSCAFNIAVNWSGATPPTTTWTQDGALSTNCTF